MDLVMRGSILRLPKTNMVRIPSCKHNRAMLMLQTHHRRMHAMKIGHSIICQANDNKPPLSSGGGGKTNGGTARSLSELSVPSDLSSSNSTAQKDVNDNKADVDANPKEN